MTSSVIGHWAFVLGILLAVIVGFGGSIPAFTTILFVLGLIVGFLNVTERESTPFLVAVIALLTIGIAGLGAVPYLGWLGPIINNVIAFVTAAGLIVAIKQVLSIARRGETQ